MKIKTTTNDVIDSTRLLMQFSDNPESIISSICKTHRITQDFIREFSQYVTPEMFMTSYRLSKTLIENNPHLFNEETFKELLKYKEIEVEGSEDDQLNNLLKNAQNMMKQSNGNPTNAQLQQFVCGFGEAETKIIKIDNLPNISLSVLCDYINEFNDNEDYNISNELIMGIIREATDSEIADSDIGNLMGLGREVDELILKRIKDDETRNSILLALAVSDEPSINITSASYKYMDNELKENLIGTDDVRARDFIEALSESKDLGWQKKMIEKAVSGELIFEKTNHVYDKEMLVLVSNLPEDLIVKLTSIYIVIPNTFSYKLMTWLLENKDFTEQQLIEMKEVFKRAGLYFSLKKLAIENEYGELLNALKS